MDRSLRRARRDSKVLLLLLVSLMRGQVALGQVRPVLTVSFDQDLAGVGLKGPVAGIPQGKPALVPGKSGQALQVGPTFGQVDYPTTGLLNPRAGTIEMWVCPVDWQPDDGKFHVFFQAKEDGALYLYKYWIGNDLLMLTCKSLEGPYASSQRPTSDWKPGEWRHIAGTWSNNGVQCYIDGKPAGRLPVEGFLPKSLGETFTLGDQPWQFERTTSSLIDEVRVYDRALTPQHLAAHFAGHYDFTLPLSKETARLDYRIDSAAGEARITLDTGGADAEDAQLGGSLAVVGRGGALPAEAAPLSFTGGQASVVLPVSSRKPGGYDIVAAVTLGGKPALELRQDLIIPSTDWLGNKIGLDDKVLPPWTPVKVSGGIKGSHNAPSKAAEPLTIFCWGREYSFGESGLPTQIKSAGKEILSRPIALHVTGGGSELTWEDSSVRLISVSKTRAELSGSVSAKAKEVEVAFTTHVVAEYDGLVLVDVTCDRPESLSLQAVSLEIPVKAEHALYRHRYATSWIPVSGNVPPGEGVVDKTPFVPFAWLGDNDRGLFWFCESDEMWPNSKSDNAIEIVRSGDTVMLRLNLLQAGQKLPTNWKFTLGLQVTPVKPIPKDWRKWRFQGQGKTRKATVNIVWPVANKKDSLKYFGFPEAADPDAFAKNIKDLHARGEKAIPYLCLTYITGSLPEWKFFEKSWAMGPTDPSIPEAGWNHTFHMVSPVGKGYGDFIVWRTKQFMERYGIDGVYHDQTHPYSSNSLDSGVGYERDGKACQTYPILGFRALYRRDYAMVKSLPRPTFTNAHMSGKVTIPILSYDDSYLDGEHFRGVVKDSYLDVMTLDSFRAEYMGRQWGLMPFFLPEFDAEHAAQVEPTRGMMALLMLHDVSPWPIWCNEKVVNEAFAALDEFGYVHSEFIPYFSSAPPATTDMKDVYVSAYKRADGRALLVVGNLSTQDREGEIVLDPRRFGLRPQQVRSWPDKQPLKVTNGRLHLKTPRLGYRMVVLATR